jgi:hypothetical protein
MDLDFIKMGLLERIAHIEENLLKQDPLLPVHLANIHSSLIQYEELIHVLSDAEIKALVAGQKKHTAIQLVAESVKKPSTRVAKNTAADF